MRKPCTTLYQQWHRNASMFLVSDCSSLSSHNNSVSLRQYSFSWNTKECWDSDLLVDREKDIRCCPFLLSIWPFKLSRLFQREQFQKKLYLMTISVSRVEAIFKDDYKRQKKLALLLGYFNVLAKAIKIRIYGELNPFLSRYLITEHKISFALAPCLMPKGHRIMCVHAKRTKVLIQPKCLQNGRISKLN